MSLAQLCQRVARRGIQIKVAALWHQLDKWKLSFKKTLHAGVSVRLGNVEMVADHDYAASRFFQDSKGCLAVEPL